MRFETSDISPEVVQLQSLARRIETPCGEGSLVWHRWGTPGERPPIVLLHGGSGSWTHWLRNILPLVNAGHEVLAADLPGFGDSAVPPSGADADAMPAPLESGLQVLLQGRVCQLVGFSFGGMVAGLFAARFPQRVAHLVLVGAPALGVVTQRVVPLQAWRHLEDAAEREAAHRSNLASLMLRHPASLTPLALQIHVANVMRDRLPRRRLAYTDVLAQALGRVSCPVHAIYGAGDALYQGRFGALATTLQAAPTFRGLTLVPDAGHWVQFEAADAFNTALLAVLDDGAWAVSAEVAEQGAAS